MYAIKYQVENHIQITHQVLQSYLDPSPRRSPTHHHYHLPTHQKPRYRLHQDQQWRSASYSPVEEENKDIVKEINSSSPSGLIV